MQVAMRDTDFTGLPAQELRASWCPACRAGHQLGFHTCSASSCSSAGNSSRATLAYNQTRLLMSAMAAVAFLHSCTTMCDDDSLASWLLANQSHSFVRSLDAGNPSTQAWHMPLVFDHGRGHPPIAP